MMLLILIKNNLKLMLRSKSILFLMTILPLLVIGVLSSVFEDMLGGDRTIEEIHAGYTAEMAEKEEFGTYWDSFVQGCAKKDIYLKEYEASERQRLFEQGTADAFLVMEEDQIILYHAKDKELEAMVLNGVVASFMQGVQGGMPIESPVKAKKLAVDPIPTAIDYYGIIELVYFAWAGMVSLAVVISSERKNKIENRLAIAPVSKPVLYLGKMIPCVLATIIETLITMVLSIQLYDIHWGRLPASMGILLLLCIASGAVGVLLFYLFKSVVVSIVAGYLGLITIGFLGGTFNMYMYSYPEHVQKWSVQYYINRTLVEFSTMGESAYAQGCVVFLFAIIAVSILLGLAAMNKRMEA